MSAKIWYTMLFVVTLSLPCSVWGLRLGQPGDNGGAGQQASFWNMWQGSDQESTAAVDAITPTLAPTPNPTPSQRKLNSCPASQQAVSLDYSLSCSHTLHTSDQGCGHPQTVCVEGVPVTYGNQRGNPAKILYNNNQRPRGSDQFYWYCSGSRENFRPDEAGEFNYVESYRRGNERGIWFEFRLCRRAGSINIPDSHHRVILKQLIGPSYTLLKANGIGAGGGTSFTNERLGATLPADLDDNKVYYLEIIDSTKMKIRSKPSADRNLDVCVQIDVAHQNYCEDVDAVEGDTDEEFGYPGSFGILGTNFYYIYPEDTPWLPLSIPTDQPPEVYLFTVGAGVMRTLHLSAHPIFGHNGAAPNQIGQLRFLEFDNERTFRLQEADGENVEFHLTPNESYRQRVNACLEASVPVTITSCLSGGSVSWKTNNGRIVASRDASSCLNIDPNTFEPRKGPCSSDATSFVSIIPKIGFGTGGTYGKNFNQLPGIFPKSGFHLVGGTNLNDEGRYFSQVKVRPDSTNGSVLVTGDTALELTFVLDGPEGTRHRVCFDLTDDTLPCANLAGSEIPPFRRTKTVNLDTATEGRENLYLIDLKQEFDTAIVSKYVRYLIFEQTGEASTRSRFYNIAFFQKAGAQLSANGRRHNKLIMDLTIRPGLPDMTGLHFQAQVTVQDIDGPYRNGVTAAEESLIPLDLSNNRVTIENLYPGRRYNIRLDPVNSSGQKYNNDLRTVKAAFIEWTSCSCGTTEYTGKPAQFTVTQEKGLMKTAFIDKSVCEEAFSFTRTLIHNGQDAVIGEPEIAYAPSFYISTKACTDEEVTPGKDFLDEVSGLLVGNTYQYRVAAVAPEYMVNQEPSGLLDGSMDDRSEDVSFDVEVKWESSATIEVSLTVAAGSIPVEGTRLQWELIKCPGSCTTMDSASTEQIITLENGEKSTPSNGKVHIEFYIDPDRISGSRLDGTSQLGLRIRPSKTAEDGTAHIYKCNNEAHTCPASGFVTTLAHLETTTVQFADATLIPMQGTVYMGDSTGATRCPLSGVQVCPHRVEGSVALGPDRDDVAGECVETGRDGTYSLNVVLNTRVYPVVSLSGHDFEPHALNSKTNRYATGIEASFAALAAGDFHGHDFFDSTITTLDVIVAGGVCDHRLGAATVQVTFQECSSDLWTQTVYQDTVRGSWEVPAQKVIVKITALQDSEPDDREFIMVQYLNNEVKRLDLSEIQPPAALAASDQQPPAPGSPTTSPTSSPTTAPISGFFAQSTGHLVRFQYNGVLNIEPKIESPLDLAAGTKCASYERDGSVFHTKSFHVLKTGSEFDLIMYLSQLILPDESPPVYCDIVDSSTEVTVENKVGIDPSEGASTIEKNALSKFRRSGIDTTRYTRCVQTCTVSPEPAVVPGGEFADARTTAVLELQAGIPEFSVLDGALHPYSKQITLRSGDTRHVMHVVVKGDYSDDDSGDSFPLPTYEPLMIIRDPPGGESSVTYTNIRTTTKISIEHLEMYEGSDFGVHLGLASDIEAKFNLGLGMAPGPEPEQKVTKVGGSILFGRDDERESLLASGDGDNSVELSFIWSYSTAGSTGQGYAGKESDVFLVPTMLVMYRETQTINFDLETCTATKPPNEVKFDLASQDNKQPFSFLSYYLVMQEILPELERNLESDLFRRQTATGAELLRIEEQLNVTRASLDGWHSILDKYEETNNQAYLGEGLNSAGKWFVQTKEVRPTCSMRSFEGWSRTVNEMISLGYQYKCTNDEDNEPTMPLIDTVCENFAQNKCAREDAEYDRLYTESLKPDSSYTVGDWSEIPADHQYWEIWEFDNPQIDQDLVSLAPPKLLDEASPLTTTTTLLEQQSVSLSPLKSTGTIHFSGGGSILSLEFDRAKMDEISNMWSNDLKPNANTDDHRSIGGDTEGEVTFGGIGIGFSGHYHTTDFTTHRMDFGTDQSRSTNIRVELGDPDAEDEFVVDMYLDDVYGTFVFATRDGSRSKCPNENNTKPIEDPFIDIAARPGVTPTDELMVFDVRIENKGWGESTFYLLSDKLQNSGGLEIEIDGANLNIFSPWRLKGTNYGGTYTQSTLTIKKGPQLDNYDAVDIYLQSRCEFSEEYGRARNSASLYNKVVAKPPTASPQTSSTTAAAAPQYDYYIEFTPPCLAVRWSGTLLKEGKFTVNSSSPASVAVSIFNPLYLKKKMAEMERFPLNVDSPGRIMLEYRKVSGEYQDWIPGVDDETGTEINFLTAPEDSFGFATVQWRAPAYDATFEIRLRSVCLPYILTAPQKINSYVSTSMFGIVDKRPPSVFGLPSPQTNLHPGQELKVEFDEDVDCEKEFVFNVKMTIEGYQDPFESNSGALAVLCVENFITIQLLKSRTPYDALLGRKFTLTIVGVTDLVGNVLQSFEYTSNFVCDPPKPRLTITHPSGPSRKYLPHDTIIFEAVIANDNDAFAWSTSVLELGVDLSTNLDDFQVMGNGQPLTSNQLYTLDGGENLTTEIAVLKGPGSQLQFPPLTLFLRSDCVQDGHDPVEVTAQAYNFEDDSGGQFIQFTPPCPPIRWAGNFNDVKTLILGGDALTSINSALEVSIFNLGYADRLLFDRSIYNPDADNPRLEDVSLFYRRVGEWGLATVEDWQSSQWTSGTLKDSKDRQTDFSRRDIEDILGYATLIWDLTNVAESAYEVRVVSRCQPILEGIVSELDSYSTEVVRVVIDRTPPRVYGAPELSLPSGLYPYHDTIQRPNHFYPSHEYVLSFTETLRCDQPFVFDLSVTVGTGTEPYDNLHVICEGSNIKFKFDYDYEEDGAGPESLVNKDVTVSLSGVQDLAGNAAEDYVKTYHQCDTDISDVNRQYRGMGCDGLDNDCDLLVDECDEDMIPPVLLFKEGLCIDSSEELQDDTIIINSPMFSSPEEAVLFLESVVKAEDDCASSLTLPQFHFDLAPPASENTIFTATVTNPRCPQQSGGIHTVVQKYGIRVCLAVEWAGSLKQEGQFIVNLGSPELDIQVKNPLSASVPPVSMEDNQRLEHVYLDYKRISTGQHHFTQVDYDSTVATSPLQLTHGSTEWQVGLDRNTNQPLDFKAGGGEMVWGNVTRGWKLPDDGVSDGIADDGIYEIRLRSVCPGSLEYVSPSIVGVIDRTPPRVYGAPEVSLPSGLYPYHDTIQRPNHFHPSHEYVLSFTESLHCDQPFVFDLSVTVGVSTEPYDNLHVICEESNIKFRFDYDYEEDGAGPESLVNKDVTVRLSGVQDLAGNVAEDYVKTYHQCDTDISDVNRQYRGMGCDGLDNDCDLLVDECDEDMIPPVLSFKDGLSIDSSEELQDGTIIINSPTFDSLEKGRKYLERILTTEDDCAVALSLQVSSPPVARCEDTRYTVTVHDTRCPDHQPQIIEQIYALKVDTTPPVVNIVLERDAPISNRVYFDPNGKYIHIDVDTFDFEDIEFSYTVEDECHQDAQVEITVLSNEFEYAHSKTSMNMVLIEEEELPDDDDRRQSHRVKIFVEANACQREGEQGFLHSKPLCKWDPDTSPFRFYNVRVKATNYAELVETETVTVIILEEDYVTKLRRYGDRYDDNEFFIKFARSTPPRKVIATKRLEWDTSASPSQLSLLRQDSIQSNAEVEESTRFIAALASTLTIGGLNVTANQAVMKATLTESIIESLAPTLKPGQEIESVVIVSVDGNAVEDAQRRRLEDSTAVEYRVTVSQACTATCTQDTGALILNQMREVMDEQIESQGFAKILQEVAKENGVEGMQNATLFGAGISDEVTMVEESQLNVALSSTMKLQSMDLARAGDNVKSLVFIALEASLQTIGCSVVAARSCTVKVISFNGAPVYDIQSWRRLQTSAASEIEFDVIIDVACDGSVNCADATALANLLNEQVTRAIEESLEQGELTDSLWALLPDSVAQDILMNIDLTPGLPNPENPNDTTQQPVGFYPDFEGLSVRCLSSENAPTYMNGDATWFYPTLEECCLASFPEFPKVCTGSSVGFYPDWESAKNACSNDDEKIPTYIMNLATFQHKTIEECCTKHYLWDIDACITKSGGKVAAIAENEWYVNWEKEICQQNCLKNTGSNQYADQGLNCGGLAPMGEQLFRSASECCSTKLSWLSKSVCVDESKPPPTAAIGTTRWYVSYSAEKCVQDCSSEFNAVAGIVHCAGVVRDASVTLYDSPNECCSKNLGWIPREKCVAQSIKLNTGWLEELLDSLNV